MKYVVSWIVIVLIAMLAIPAVAGQAQPGVVFNELVVESPLAIATESDVGLTVQSDNSKLQNACTDFKIETTAGTLRHGRRDIQSVNIGFDHVNQSTLNISTLVSS